MDERFERFMEISREIDALLVEQYQLDDVNTDFSKSTNKVTLKKVIGSVLSAVENGREVKGYSIYNHGTTGYGPDYSIIIRLTDKEKQKEPPEFKQCHDDKACAALKRYDNGLVKTRENMERIARNLKNESSK